MSSALWQSCCSKFTFTTHSNVKRFHLFECIVGNQSVLPGTLQPITFSPHSHLVVCAEQSNQCHCPRRGMMQTEASVFLYLSLQDARLPHRGSRSPCSRSYRRSSRFRRSPGHWRSSARLAADHLPCLPAGMPGEGMGHLSEKVKMDMRYPEAEEVEIEMNDKKKR